MVSPGDTVVVSTHQSTAQNSSWEVQSFCGGGRGELGVFWISQKLTNRIVQHKLPPPPTVNEFTESSDSSSGA